MHTAIGCSTRSLTCTSKRPGGSCVGGEGDPLAKIHANRACLLALREQVDCALTADEGLASSAPYSETDERRFDHFGQRADRRGQMGEPREPERPDRSMFAQNPRHPKN